MIALALVLVLGAPKVERLLTSGRFQEAVAAAPTGDDLMKAVLKLKGDHIVRGVVGRVVRLEGPLGDRKKAIAWLEKLAAKRNGHPAALQAAGYLYLVDGQSENAAKVLEKVVAREPSGLSFGYLADAYRRLGRDADARKVLVRAAKALGTDDKFVQDNAIALAARLREKGDVGYASLLDDIGLGMRAAMWLVEDAEYKPRQAAQFHAEARRLFAKSLDESAPAVAWWAAARVERGDKRFEYLAEAVQRGEDPMGEANHACPGAILALAQECAARKRVVAAVALAKMRLRVGECVAAWELLETLPPELAR